MPLTLVCRIKAPTRRSIAGNSRPHQLGTAPARRSTLPRQRRLSGRGAASLVGVPSCASVDPLRPVQVEHRHRLRLAPQARAAGHSRSPEPGLAAPARPGCVDQQDRCGPAPDGVREARRCTFKIRVRYPHRSPETPQSIGPKWPPRRPRPAAPGAPSAERRKNSVADPGSIAQRGKRRAGARSARCQPDKVPASSTRRNRCTADPKPAWLGPGHGCG